MWTVFQLVMGLYGLAWRWWRDARQRRPSGHYGGQRYFLKHDDENRPWILRGRRPADASWTAIGMPLRTRAGFHFQREAPGEWQREGSPEFQTRDTDFDRSVYLGCDHPVVLRHLENDAVAREAVTGALGSGCTRIVADGHVVWLEGMPARTSGPTVNELAHLAKLRTAFAGIESLARHVRDPFGRRIAAIEAASYAIFFYGCAAMFSWYLDTGDVLVEWRAIGGWALLSIAALAIPLVAALLRLLRRSSRAAFVRREALILLAIGLPATGWQTAVDANTWLDVSTPVVVECDVLDKARSGSGRRSMKFHRVLVRSCTPDDFELPGAIDVSPGVYSSLRAGERVRITLGRGALGYPWYRDFEPVLPERKRS